MLVGKDLAEKMYAVYKSKDADGNTIKSTDAIVAFAEGFVQMITAGAMQSVVTGFGMPNQQPIPPTSWSFLGTSTKGNLMGLVPTLISTKLASAIPDGDASLMLKEAKAVSNYFMTQANVTFAQVVGHCTAATGSPPVPGPLLGGQAKDGKIVGITGQALATMVASDMGIQQTKEMVYSYQALCDYVMNNIELSYLPGMVNGIFVLPGPVPIPIQGGIGSGGMIR
jgi:hypothetical protein